MAEGLGEEEHPLGKKSLTAVHANEADVQACPKQACPRVQDHSSRACPTRLFVPQSDHIFMGSLLAVGSGRSGDAEASEADLY